MPPYDVYFMYHAAKARHTLSVHISKAPSALHQFPSVFRVMGQHQIPHQPDLTTLGHLRLVSLTSMLKPSLSLSPSPHTRVSLISMLYCTPLSVDAALLRGAAWP